jgi:hypothetical protein
VAKVSWYNSGHANYSASNTQNHVLGTAPQNQDTTETNAQQTVRSAGTFSNLYARIFSNGVTAT